MLVKLIAILTKLGIDTDIHEDLLEEPEDTKTRYHDTNIRRGFDVLHSLGIELGYLNLETVTTTLEAIMNYYENGSPLSQETLVEDFVVMLEQSGVDERELPELLNNIVIHDAYREFLDLTTKDGDTLLNIPDELVELQKSVTGSLSYLSYKRLLEVKPETFFSIYDIDRMDIQNILYVSKVWGIAYYNIVGTYSKEPVKLLELVNIKQQELIEQSKI